MTVALFQQFLGSGGECLPGHGLVSKLGADLSCKSL